jgi:hypothetical protein
MASERPIAAFVLSLLAGIFILLRGGLTSMMGSLIGTYRGGYGGYGGMMDGYYGNGYNGYGFGGMMNGYGFYGMMRGLGIGLVFVGLFSIVFGVIVIASALMLYTHSSQHMTWGILIVIFSVLSLFGGMMSGLGVGFILGIIGGVLAITWKPPASAAPPP